MRKIYKLELENLYLKQKLSQKEIANKLGFCAGNITKLLREYGIKKRRSSKKHKRSKKVWLLKKYKELSVGEIAEICGVSKSIVYFWLAECGIARKMKLYSDFPSLSPLQIEIIIGSLLGDGYIIYHERAVSKFSVTQNKPKCEKFPDRIEYIQWFFEILKPYSLSVKTGYCAESCFKNKDDVRKIVNTVSHTIKTHSHPIFDEIERRWYLRDESGSHIKNNSGRRIKIIPRDLILTPLIAAIWFCEDGCNQPTTRRATFYTQGFKTEECNFLVDRLQYDLGIKSHVYRNTIRIGGIDYFNFIELIKPHVIWKCFQYKVTGHTKPLPQFGETNHRAKITEKQAISVFKLHSKGWTAKKIANKFGVSKGAISFILKGKNWKHLKLFNNKGLSLANTSGCSGVYWKKDVKKWEVKFMRKGKIIRLGLFDNKEDAIIRRNNFRRAMNCG